MIPRRGLEDVEAVRFLITPCLPQWWPGISAVRSITTIQIVPTSTAAITPAATLTRSINRGTTTGKATAPAMGVRATTDLSKERFGALDVIRTIR